MKRIFLTVMMLSLPALISSCGEVVTAVEKYTSACSSYNGDRDGFSMSIDSDVVTTIGVTSDVSMRASWYDSNMNRSELSCIPTWQVDDPTVVSMTGRKVTALKPGVTRVTAVVTGNRTITESFWVAVRPTTTEVEPNNGVGFAALVKPGVSEVGYIDSSNDVDYYAADIPAGKAFQFTLQNAPKGSSSDPFYMPTFSGRIEDGNGNYLGDSNVGYINTTTQTKRIYIVVDSYSNSTTYPYSVTLELR